MQHASDRPARRALFISRPPDLVSDRKTFNFKQVSTLDLYMINGHPIEKPSVLPALFVNFNSLALATSLAGFLSLSKACISCWTRIGSLRLHFRHHTCMSAPLRRNGGHLYLHLCRRVSRGAAPQPPCILQASRGIPLIMRPRFARCIVFVSLDFHLITCTGLVLLPQTNSSLDFLSSHSIFTPILLSCPSCRPTLATQEPSALAWAP